MNNPKTGNYIAITALALTLLSWLYIGVIDDAKAHQLAKQNEQRIVKIELDIKSNYATLDDKKVDKQTIDLLFTILNNIQEDIRAINKKLSEK